MKNGEHYKDPTASRAITRVMREAKLEEMDSLRPRSVTLDTISEAEEQIAVMTWARYNEKKYSPLKWLHHIPNGGTRNKAEAVQLKRMGVKSGVPDLFLPYPNKNYHGLYIEMKSEKGRPTACQKEWIEWLTKNNYRAVICHGAKSAIYELERYLNDEA